MPLYEYEGIAPDVHPSAFIAPTATLIGSVTIEAGASVWFGAVLRGDRRPIVVRQGANVQDNAVIHSTLRNVTDVGPGVTVAHACVIHGAMLEAECLIGNGAIVLDGAIVGTRSLVGALSLVPAGGRIPPQVLAVGVPATVRKSILGTPAATWIEQNPGEYADLALRHLSTLRAVAPGGSTSNDL